MSVGKRSGWVLVGCLGVVGCGGASLEQPGAPAASVEPDAPSAPVVAAPPADTTPLPPPLPPTPLPPTEPPRHEFCSVTQDRQLQWWRSFPGRMSAMTTNAKDQIVFSTWTLEEGEALGLLDPEGQARWSRPGFSPFVSFQGMSVAPSTGQIYAWGSHTTGWSNLWGAAVYSFDASGQQPTLIGQGCDECGLGPYHEDADGNLLERYGSSRGSGISYTSRAGSSWSLSSWHDYDNFPGVFHYTAAAFDAQGQVVLVATLQDTLVFQGRTFGQPGQFTFVVLKLSDRGELLWARELPATWGSLNTVGVADSGQVVLQGHFGGRLDWPTAPISTPSIIGTDFILSLDARGEPLWFHFTASRSSLTVGPSGTSVLVSGITNPTPGVLVEEFAPEGCLRWSQTWTAQEGEGSVGLTDVAWSGDDLILGGSFKGTVDFGTGPQQAPIEAHSKRSYVMKLRHP